MKSVQMLLISAALLSFVAASFAEDPSEATNTGDVRVLSANVRYGSADDGEHSWDKRSGLTLKTLTAAKPDVLGLQEALGFQVEAIHRAFPGHALIGEGRDGLSGGEWSALLVDAERFAIRASGTFRLSPKDEIGAMGWDAACTRIATWAELIDRARPNRSFLVLNTHFDHKGKEARLMSATLIADWVEARQKARGPLPVVLMGDLNDEEESPALVALKRAGFRDTLEEKHPGMKPSGTFHGFKGGRDGRRIDYVLVSSEWQVDQAWIDWTEEGTHFPSDHRFVGAVLRQAR